MSKHDSMSLDNPTKLKFGIKPIHSLIGFLAAAYILVGRWTPVQLVDDDCYSIILEPRFWLVLGLFMLAFIPVRRTISASRDNHYSVNSGLLLLTGFMVYMMSSTLWAPTVESARMKFFEIMLMLIATLSMHRLLCIMNASAIISAFWWWVLILTGILALAAIPASAAGGRLAVFAGGPNVFGRLMTYLYITAITRMAKSKCFLGWSIVIIGAVILTLLSGSRGSMISLIVASIIFFLIYRNSFKKIFVISIICMFITLLVFLYTSIGTMLSEAIQTRVTGLMVDQVYTSGRDVIYDLAFRLFQEHPLAGVGLNGFNSITGIAYPHNVFLELLCEGGLLALGLFAIAIIAYVFAMLKKRGQLDITSLIAFVMILVASQFSGDLYDSRAIFFLPLLIVAPAVKRSQHITKGVARLVRTSPLIHQNTLLSKN